MAEYIEKEALIKALEADFSTDWADYASKNNFDKDYIDGARDEYDDVLKIICQQKSTDVQPVKRGKWVKCGQLEGKVVMKCTICEQGITSMFAPKYHFCPNCGARMDGDTNG